MLIALRGVLQESASSGGADCSTSGMPLGDRLAGNQEVQDKQQQVLAGLRQELLAAKEEAASAKSAVQVCLPNNICINNHITHSALSVLTITTGDNCTGDSTVVLSAQA